MGRSGRGVEDFVMKKCGYIEQHRDYLTNYPSVQLRNGVGVEQFAYFMKEVDEFNMGGWYPKQIQRREHGTGGVRKVLLVRRTLG